MNATMLPVDPHLVGKRATLREALRVIDSCSTKIVIVVDNEGRLARTVTDGDIRRGLLRGEELESCVGDLPGRVPISCPVGSSRAIVGSLLDEHDISAVVMTDPRGTPVGLFDRASIAGLTFMSPPDMGSQEIEFVRAAFEDNWIAPAGPNLIRFEECLAVSTDRKHALAVSSGTAAIHLALRSLRTAPGDRVYVSDLTFAASLQPVLYERAVPVLIDSEPTSWNMSRAALSRKLATDAERNSLPRAIILVHLYGQPADVTAICRIADQYNVPVIEDAAESLGATFANRPSGSHGLLAAFSFNGNKIITTSGGGALVGDDSELLDYARYLSTQGREALEHYQHNEVAYNYRMSNVLAGIGIGQLELLPDRVAKRRAVYRRYREGLADVLGVDFQSELPGSIGNRWLTVALFDSDFIELHPYQIMRNLGQSGIETRPGWKPMHMQPLCAGFEFEPHDGETPVSPRLFFQSLCLPSGSSLSIDEQERIIAKIRKIIERA